MLSVLAQRIILYVLLAVAGGWEASVLLPAVLAGPVACGSVSGRRAVGLMLFLVLVGGVALSRPAWSLAAVSLEQDELTAAQCLAVGGGSLLALSSLLAVGWASRWPLSPALLAAASLGGSVLALLPDLRLLARVWIAWGAVGGASLLLAWPLGLLVHCWLQRWLNTRQDVDLLAASLTWQQPFYPLAIGLLTLLFWIPLGPRLMGHSPLWAIAVAGGALLLGLSLLTALLARFLLVPKIKQQVYRKFKQEYSEYLPDPERVEEAERAALEQRGMAPEPLSLPSSPSSSPKTVRMPLESSVLSVIPPPGPPLSPTNAPAVPAVSQSNPPTPPPQIPTIAESPMANANVGLARLRTEESLIPPLLLLCVLTGLLEVAQVAGLTAGLAGLGLGSRRDEAGHTIPTLFLPWLRTANWTTSLPSRAIVTAAMALFLAPLGSRLLQPLARDWWAKGALPPVSACLAIELTTLLACLPPMLLHLPMGPLLPRLVAMLAIDWARRRQTLPGQKLPLNKRNSFDHYGINQQNEALLADWRLIALGIFVNLAATVLAGSLAALASMALYRLA